MNKKAYLSKLFKSYKQNFKIDFLFNNIYLSARETTSAKVEFFIFLQKKY